MVENMIYKIGKVVVGVIYGIGTIITFILFMIVLLRINVILFPDAMLPMKLYELASNWLVIGTIPMFVASILFHNTYKISKDSHKKRHIVFVYIPAIICCGFLFYWIYEWTIGSILYILLK